jgi:type IV pilus assembly protein PilV
MYFLNSKSPTVNLHQRGVSLLEILVTLIVLSIGLLGLAALQIKSERVAHNAALRYLAVVNAYDMVDRMRANRSGVNAGAYNNISGIGSDPGCISTGCTASQMATTDKYQWNTNLASQLPSGAGTVSGTGANSIFTITVTWNEIGPGASVATQKSFVLKVQL